jgi:hypothetical protein
MNQDDLRASLLDHLVAVSHGDEMLRELFASSPIERIKAAIRDYEQANADIARYGRLGAEWADSSFDGS